MRSQKKMALFGLGGGVALASAAFAVGSQAGGGSAVAGTSTSASSTTSAAQIAPIHNGGRGGPRHDLSDFAKRLGVEESRLEAALEDLRPDRESKEDHRAEHVADLARILKLDEAKVKAAIEKVGPERGPRGAGGPPGPPAGLVADLAKDLELSEAKVRAALEKVRPEPPAPGPRPERRGFPDKDAFLTTLAKELGVPSADLQKAIEDHRPRRDHHRGGPGGPISDELAKELGVSTETLENAFETLHEQRRAEFAKELAARLSISTAKVEEVLKELPHPGKRGHR